MASSIQYSPYADVQMSDVTLPDYCLDAFAKFANSTAIICANSGIRYSFGEVIEKVKQLTAGLRRRGVEKGHKIATLVSNCAENVFVSLAAQRLGAIITTCNPAYKSGEILAQFLDSGVDFVLTQEEQLPKLETILAELPALKEVIVVERVSSTHVDVNDLMDTQFSAELSLPVNVATLNANTDMSYIFYSSGTTGLPKGVMNSHTAIVSNNMIVTRAVETEGLEMIRYTPADVVLSLFPSFHIGGVLTNLMTLTGGATTLIMPKYHPTEFLSNIEKFRATSLMVPPPIMVFLAKAAEVDDYDLSSVQTIFVGAAPVPNEILKLVKRRLRVKSIAQAYGMTETGPLTHMLPLSEIGQQKLALGSCGVALANIQCRVVDVQSQQDCGANVDGELWVRTPSVMSGYLHNAQATADTITADGWLKTGDIARYDEEGYYYIVDRLKELIKVRGFQVAPAELEAVLLTHEHLSDALVVGVPDLNSGELPRAYVVLKPGRSVSAEDIERHVQERVASYKRLAGGVRFVDSVPKTASGKLLRRQIRDGVIEEHRRHRSSQC